MLFLLFLATIVSASNNTYPDMAATVPDGDQGWHEAADDMNPPESDDDADEEPPMNWHNRMPELDAGADMEGEPGDMVDPEMEEYMDGEDDSNPMEDAPYLYDEEDDMPEDPAHEEPGD